MTVGLSYLSDLSRVQIAISNRPNGTVHVERSLNESNWALATTVRGGVALPVQAGAAQLYDYEFAADQENFYRVTQTSVEDNVDILNTAGNHTWNKPPGLLAVWVRGVGPSSAGGGAATTSSGQASIGGGGAEGGYFELWIPADDLPSSVACTVGTGGVAASGAAGGDGGGTGTATTSFGTFGVANGATGGGFAAATSGAASASGGTGGSATVDLSGTDGTGYAVTGNDGYSGLIVGGSIVMLGLPAPSHLGRSRRPGTSTAGANGQSGTHAAGSGGFNFASQGSARTGGGGGAGLLLIQNIFGG